MDDEQIQKHGLAALFQMLIKHHSDKSIYRLLKKLIEIHALQDTINNAKSDNYLQSVLDYIDITADSRDDRQEDIDSAIDALKAALPEQEGDIMTWTQQFEKRGLAKGIEQGIQQGMQQGAQHEKYEIAKNMLRKGYNDAEIIGLTGLDIAIIAELKSEIEH
jgi:predicted transposase/invertase (TIGR01784 family)